MNNYIVFIALGIVFCLLAIVISVFLYCRRIEKKCNFYIAKSIREQDCLAKELERTRIEKEMIEKVLKAELPDTVVTFVKEKETDDCVSAHAKHGRRIEITFFI